MRTKMKAKDVENKYALIWSKQIVKSSLKMLEDNLDTLHIDKLDARGKMLAELTMHNLFASILTACKTIRNLREEAMKGE